MSTVSHHLFGDGARPVRSAIALRPNGHLPNGDLEERFAHAPLRRVEAKEFLYAEGDTVSHLYRIETGSIALFKVLNDGRRQILGFAYAGDLIGLGAEREHVMNAQTIKPTRVRCLPIGLIRQAAAKDPALALKLYQAIAEDLAATRDLLLTTGQRNALERVAGFLVAFSRRNDRNGDDPTSIQLPMTRTDIGDFLGLTIETVSRTFTKLKLQQLIELPQCSHVQLLDIDRLERLAEGQAGCV